jgi:RES domain-containing protein
MKVYRIALAKFAELIASGREGRWFSEGNFAIYTSENRALACLENVVHRDYVNLRQLYKVLIIEIPDNLEIIDVIEKYQIKDTELLKSASFCRKMGDEWYRSLESCILKVPSVVIKHEFNFLLNTQHPDFVKIKITEIEDFNFDSRIKK